MSQLYTVSYTCDFDLNMFPFDTQVKEKDTNHLHFVLKKKNEKKVYGVCNRNIINTLCILDLLDELLACIGRSGLYEATGGRGKVFWHEHAYRV